MRWFSENVLERLLARHTPPCLSLYMPTHRSLPGTLQDAVLFQNLVDDAELSLRQAYQKRQVDALLTNLRAYSHDPDHWRRQLDGLAVFVCRDSFSVIQVQRPVWPVAIVADAFHVKPLLRIMQSLDRYHVLGLSRGGLTLYEGNQYALDPIEVEGIPEGVVEAFGAKWARSQLVGASDTRARGFDAVASRNGHGDGDGGADEEEDVVRFLRAVDRAVWRHHSRPSGLPLMLAAPAEYHAIFRQVSHNLNLLPDGVACDPSATSAEELRGKAWRVFEPHYSSRIARQVQRYQMARHRDAASDDLAELARAAVLGQVETLITQADRHVGGRIDPVSGEVTWNDAADPRADDLLDDLAEHVLRTDGDVYVIPAERMPVTSGAAGVFRY